MIFCLYDGNLSSDTSRMDKKSNDHLCTKKLQLDSNYCKECFEYNTVHFKRSHPNCNYESTHHHDHIKIKAG